MSRKGGWYDEADDYYDEDDDWDDGFGEYDTGNLAAKKKPAGGGGNAKGGAGGGKAPGAAAGKAGKQSLKGNGNKTGSQKPPPQSTMAATLSASVSEKGVVPNEMSKSNRGFPPAPPMRKQSCTSGFDFAVPSPDDAILAKRSGGGGGDGSPGVQLDGNPESLQMSKLKVSEPSPEPARCDYASYQPSPDELAASSSGSRKLHLVVLGHVDAGKSTLMGRVLHAVGEVSDRAHLKNTKDATAAGKGSFLWAWALDERPEERSRGVTVDVARAKFNTCNTQVTLLDAPGHKDFVPNAISGMSQADCACLVLDASRGGFESGFGIDSCDASVSYADSYSTKKLKNSGQTREHVRLAKSLGVEWLIVAVSKMDAVGYDKVRFTEIKRTIEPFLKTSGFAPEKVMFVPVSGVEGVNLVGNTPTMLSWYNGPSLTSAIDAIPAVNRGAPKPFRMPVTEIVSGDRALGNCACGGKVEAGSVKPGDKVLVQPSGQIAIVKHVRVVGGEGSDAKSDAKTAAFEGDAVDIGLENIDVSVLAPGSVLCHPDWPLYPTKKLTVKLMTLDTVRIPILIGASIVLHHYANSVDAKVSKLCSLIDKKTGDETKKDPRCLTREQTALVEITVKNPICVERYVDFKSLGRVQIRRDGATIGLGVVMEVF